MPAVELLYQSIVDPAAVVAEIFTIPGAHLSPPTPIGAAGVEITVAVTDDLVADKHPVVIFLPSA